MESLAGVAAMSLGAHVQADVDGVGSRTATGAASVVTRDVRSMPPQEHAATPEVGGAATVNVLGVSAHAHAVVTEVGGAASTDEQAAVTEDGDAASTDAQARADVEMQDAVPTDELGVSAHARARADTTEVRDSVPMYESSEGQLEMMVSAEVEVSMSVEDKWGVARDGVMVAATVADTVLAAVQFGVHAGFTVGRFLATGTARVATAGAVMVVAMNAAGDDEVSDAGEHVLLTLARVTRVSMTAHAAYVLRT
jgi:hypothetical protein